MGFYLPIYHCAWWGFENVLLLWSFITFHYFMFDFNFQALMPSMELLVYIPNWSRKLCSRISTNCGPRNSKTRPTESRPEDGSYFAIQHCLTWFPTKLAKNGQLIWSNWQNWKISLMMKNSRENSWKWSLRIRENWRPIWLKRQVGWNWFLQYLVSVPELFISLLNGVI